MRARRTLSVPTAAKLVVGASALAFPATAVAVTADRAGAVSAPAALHETHAPRTAYGARTLVHGSVPAADAGAELALEYRPSGAQNWRVLDRGRVGPHGGYALVARIGRSGRLRVVPVVPARTATNRAGSPLSVHSATASTLPAATETPAPSPFAGLASSPSSTILVRPRLALAARSAGVIAGQSTLVRGHLWPGVAGRRLTLQVRRGGHWVAVARAHTRRGGSFAVRYRPAAEADQMTRVSFAGDRLNTGAQSAPEAISAMQYAEVSWYDDAGSTACGFHATDGMASRTLPCGSKVTLSYGGRTVTATVDDRGPFVYSRLYDLDQTTAAALGMNGVATVLASV